MFNFFRSKKKTPLMPLYDPALLQAIADKEILLYRVQLLRGINYSRLIFAGLLLWYFCIVENEGSSFNILFITTEHDYDQLRLFWTIFSAYVLVILMCNLTLRYKAIWRRIFILMAFIEILLLIMLLAVVFNQQLANINMMMVLSSLMLSVLTLTYFESIFFGVTLSLVLFVYLIKVWMQPQLSLILHDNNGIQHSIAAIWRTLIQYQFELVDPIIYSASLSLIITMIGFLASQARDNKIMSRISHLYNNQLHELNNSIIEDMKSGLIVVNAKGAILTLNHQAKKLFGLDTQSTPPKTLSDVSLELTNKFDHWQHVRFSDERSIELAQNTYSITFNSLHQHENIDLTLITLESVEDSMQRIREARLVSLGRLSAGIAHEIRNPLASIQGAADILAEMDIDKQTSFLVNKITNNAKRVNIIVSDVLNMFNVVPREKKLIRLNSELQNIVTQARQDPMTKDADIVLTLQESDPYCVYFDSGHLSQVINNFIINSIVHGEVDKIRIAITSQISKISKQIYLDVSDNGKGVNKIDQDRIFEPFFSKRNGTGLGLFLIREMCLANQAQIEYIQQDKGACFRIIMDRYLCEEQCDIPD